MSSPYTPYLRCPSPLYLIRPIKKEDDYGKITLVYESIEEAMANPNQKFYGIVQTYQGTKTTIDTQTVWEDTAQITTRYNPSIELLCKVYNPINRKLYEVVNEPENLYEQGLYTVFTVRRVESNV